MTYESIFGDKALAAQIDQHIQKRMKTYTQFCELCGVELGTVDFYTILKTRALNLYRKGNLSSERKDKVLRYLNADGYDTDFIKYTGDASAPTINSNSTPVQKVTSIMETKTIHTVNGQDVTKMSLEGKLVVLRDSEKKLADLKAITTKSKLVAAEIKKVETFIADVTALFDADVA